MGHINQGDDVLLKDNVDAKGGDEPCDATLAEILQLVFKGCYVLCWCHVSTLFMG